MNAKTLKLALSDIDDRFITEAEASKTRRPVWRGVAAAAAAVLLIFGAVFAAVKLFPFTGSVVEAAVSTEAPVPQLSPHAGHDVEAVLPTETPAPQFAPVTVPEDAVLPPDRLGSIGRSKAEFKHFADDLDEAFAESDLVCIGTVENWLGERYDATFFEVSVEKTYKGEAPEKIVIGQYGTAEYGGPIALFTYGDRMLFFLRSFEGFELILPPEWENAYWIGGELETMIDIIVDKDGTVYACDIMGQMSEYITVQNYADDTELTDRLRAIMAEYDSLAAKERKFMYVYLLEDLENTYLSK